MNYREANTRKFVTAKDIVIPAGTEIGIAPSSTVRLPFPFAEALIAINKDMTASWTMPLDEAIEAGLVRET